MHKMCFYVNLSCVEANCGERFGSVLAFLMECLAFFSDVVGRFWPFFTGGLAFFENINMTTLLGVVLTSDGSWNKESDRRIAKANAVLREPYCVCYSLATYVLLKRFNLQNVRNFNNT